MHPLLNIAQEAAKAAGKSIRYHLERFDAVEVQQKGRNDFVSQVDFEAEQRIIQTIRKYHPDHAIMAEETGRHKTNSRFEWIIDPLDGTTNFLHQFPHFAVSIAVTENGKLQHAAIYDPVKDEMFSASRGEGAWLNQSRIRVSEQKELENSLMATGFPYYQFDYADEYLAGFKRFMTETAGVRRAGSAALDLAYVACGRVDGYWEYNLKPWDIAAGALIVKEAGGLVTDFGGGENYLQSGNILATNPKLYKHMAQIIGQTAPANRKN